MDFLYLFNTGFLLRLAGQHGLSVEALFLCLPAETRRVKAGEGCCIKVILCRENA